jgi:hypothetical protein
MAPNYPSFDFNGNVQKIAAVFITLVKQRALDLSLCHIAGRAPNYFRWPTPRCLDWLETAR